VPDEAHDWSQGAPQRIRPLALVVARRDDGAILVAAGFDHAKQQRFYRPLGGEIEYGERAEDAARRELQEEIGAELARVGLLAVVENLFTYQGRQGHELVWLFEADLTDRAFYERDVIIADEAGARFEAHWVPVETFLRGEAPLYPDGLLDLLQS
jgi:ADP-ribose pyrophosphatase YjhB (NUDIX family)